MMIITFTPTKTVIEYKHNGKNISTVGIDVSYAQGDIVGLR